MTDAISWTRALLAREFFYSFMMIIYGSSLHIIWAILAIYDHAAYNSTAFAALKAMAGPTLTPWVCLIVALLAICAFVPTNPVTRISLMIPQQAVFVISSVGAILAIWHGYYADHTIRPRAFIMADQMPVILGAICYSIAIVFSALAHRIRSKQAVAVAAAVQEVTKAEAPPVSEIPQTLEKIIDDGSL